MRCSISLLSTFLVALALDAAGDTQGTKAFPPLPEAFSSFGAVVCDGYVYVYGGHVGKTHTYSTAAVTGKFRRLKLAEPAKGWQELPPGPGLQGLALVSHGGKVYRIGGMQPRNKPGDPADNISTASCAIFDPATGAWHALPDLPAGRSSHDAAVAGDLIVVAGGWHMHGQGQKATWHDTALILDLGSKPLAWQPLPQPFARRALNLAALDGKVYVVGGMSSANETEKTVDILDPISRKWARGPLLPGSSRNGFTPAACTCGGKLYVSPADGKVYRLTKKLDAWEEVAALETKRIVHRIVPVKDDVLMVLGGAGRGSNVAATEAIEVGGAKVDIWPGFRGDGTCVTAAKNLPLHWSPSANIGWKVDLPGYGQSSPVVWQDKVFVTAVSGEQRDKGYVLAYDAGSGKLLWRHEFVPTQKAKWSMMISRAAPTPLVDAHGLFAFFEGGELLALSHEGKPRWTRSLVKEYGEFQNGHGLGASLAQTDEAVVVLVDHRGPSYLLAVDKKTGKTLWKTERASRGSWSSPVVIRRDGKQMVIVSSNGSVAGYEAQGGKLLWEMTGLVGNTIPSATVWEDWVVVGAGAGKGKEPADPNKAAESTCCLKLTRGATGYDVCWKATKATASYASPLVHRGLAYFVSQVGVLHCIDVKTGKEQYAERIDGSCWATPIGAGDHVYFFGKNGRTTVLKAGRVFEKVATNALWPEAGVKAEAGEGADAKGQPAEGKGGGGSYVDPILYGVAAVDGAFFVRSGTMLFRISHH